MARVHGSAVRAYLGGRDISGDAVSIAPQLGAPAVAATTFGSAGWQESDPGMCQWSAAIEAFYDPAAGGIGRQWETLLGATGSILSWFDGDGDTIGETGFLGSDAVLTQRGQPITVGDLIKLRGTLAGNGRPGVFAKLLHPKGQETISGQSSSLNNGAASASGYRATLHVTAITGSWTIKVQQSSDNGSGDAWADLVAFTQVTAAGGVTAETKTGTGAVEQYLRVTFTEDVAGSITFVVGFARY